MEKETFVPMERELGTRIMKLRGEMTQDYVAQSIGVRRETVKQWENAERHIKAIDLVKISNFFNVSVDYLLGLTEQKSISADIKTAQKTLAISEKAVDNFLYLHERLPEQLKILDQLLSSEKLVPAIALIGSHKINALKQIEIAVGKYNTSKDFQSSSVFASMEAQEILDYLVFKGSKEIESLLRDSVFCEVIEAVNSVSESSGG